MYASNVSLASASTIQNSRKVINLRQLNHVLATPLDNMACSSEVTYHSSGTDGALTALSIMLTKAKVQYKSPANKTIPFNLF